LENVLVEDSEGIQALDGVVLCNPIHVADDHVNAGNLLLIEGSPMIIDTGFNDIETIFP
jgi:hypothetical protein